MPSLYKAVCYVLCEQKDEANSDICPQENASK